MKGYQYVLLVFCLGISVSGKSQEILESTFDYRVENKTISAALLELARVSQVNINFNPDIIPDHLRVSYKEDDATVISILRDLLKGTDLRFDIVNDQIIVYKNQKVRRFRITGTLENKLTGERLVGANVYDPIIRKGTVSNDNGFFSVSMPEGKRKIAFSFLGFQPETILLDLHKNESFRISLEPSLTLDEILVYNSDSIDNGLINQSMITLHKADLVNVSGIGGEADLFSQLQRIAGVQTGADGLGGLNIRGGSEDQNLIVVDGSPIYYANHLFGVFSMINSEGLSTASFAKSNFLSPRGKRLSSEIGVKLKSGNTGPISGSASVNLIALKTSVEAPLSSKTSFSISGRKSLSLPIRILPVEDFRNNADTDVNFYDLQLRLKSNIDERNSISITGLYGFDQYTYSLRHEDNAIALREDRNYEWSSSLGNIEWTYLIKDNLFLKTTTGYARFQYNVYNISSFSAQTAGPQRIGNLLKLASQIEDFHLKLDFDLFVNGDHFSQFGLAIVNHNFSPNLIFVNDTSAGQFISPNYTVETITASNNDNPPKSSFNQYDLYLQHNMTMGRSSRLQVGLFGTYLGGENVSRFIFLPKISFQQRLTHFIIWTVYGQKSAQYFHKIDIDPATYPNSIWVPVSDIIKPKSSWLVNTSIDLKLSNGTSLRLEAYYNWLNDYLIFPSTPIFSPGQINVNSPELENELLIQSGKSYGLEMSFTKQWPAIQFEGNYTISRILRQVYDDDQINILNRYPFDRSHTVNLTTTLKPKSRWNINFLFLYGSNNSAIYSYQRFQNFLPNFDLSNIQEYELENGSTMGYNMRVDLNSNITFGSAVSHEFTLGVYNLFDRKNDLYRFVDIEPSGESEERVSVVQSLGRRLILNYRISF